MERTSHPSMGQWRYFPDLGATGQILERRCLWDRCVLSVWIPTQERIVTIPDDKADAEGELASDIPWAIHAVRIADALSSEASLAPIEAPVIPLPHQLHALQRAMAGDQVRFLLADEVGLGKTIEAGLILRELKLRGLVRRTLVIAPKGLVTQWVAEMRDRFGEEFRLLYPNDFPAYRRVARESNVWRSHSQVVCPLDSVKPIDSRRGWTRAEIVEHNQDRFEDLISAGWDLVIVDEAHRLGGSTDQVARYRLGQGLAGAAPYLLLLSATPHQGKTEAFHRILALLDPDAFPDVCDVSRERVQPYVIRTEKRKAVDVHGQPLFRPRITLPVLVEWHPTHRKQRELYEAVSEYVRTGYNQALREKKNYVGFLLILMQRLITSSTRAIRATLERRLEVLQAPEEQLTLFPAFDAAEWSDMDGQEQVESLLATRLMALKSERDEVALLLESAKRCEAESPDAKAEVLLEWIHRIRREEGDPDLKVLIFTEFVPTQQMLAEFLRTRGFEVVCLDGSMSMDERGAAQTKFATRSQVMISTDAGGEGINLQFCHVVVNYDMPWNPMRVEQRIGRVDRIGQGRVVRALNFALQDTVENRVRAVLEEKLAVILEEFGADKMSDVLDSAQGGEAFEELYRDAILNPKDIPGKVQAFANRFRSEVQETRDGNALLSSEPAPETNDAQRLMDHPLPHWVERMTVAYLQAHGGKAEREGDWWRLVWPDGTEMPRVVFSARDANAHPSARHVTLDEPRVRALAERLPRFVPGQPIPIMAISGLPGDVSGWWSLWQVCLASAAVSKRRILPLFLHEDGRVLAPTARFVWDELLVNTPEPVGSVHGQEAASALERVRAVAEDQGRDAYEDMLRKHKGMLERERDKKGMAFSARKRIIERVGLPEVRQHRLSDLAKEMAAWQDDVRQREEVLPELLPIVLIRVKGNQE